MLGKSGLLGEARSPSSSGAAASGSGAAATPVARRSWSKTASVAALAAAPAVETIGADDDFWKSKLKVKDADVVDETDGAEDTGNTRRRQR